MNYKLRNWELSDLGSLVKHADNRNIAKWLTNQFPHPYTDIDGKTFIETIMKDSINKVFAIEINGEAVGSIGIFPQSDIHCKSAEIGYWLSEQYWGKGIMPKAIEEIVEYGFHAFDIVRIYARPFSTNKGSQRVLEKAGFKQEARLEKALYKNGEYLDEIIYSKIKNTKKMTTSIPERILALRKAMKEKQIDAYIIPSSDPHLSEYPADRWKSRGWISGFNGSAGTIVITADKAGLWTDSRYFLQAEIQLEGSGIDLYRASLPETPTIIDFLSEELKEGQTVGLDGQTYSAADGIKLEKQLFQKSINLETSYDLIDTIWEDRPAIPENQIFEMPVELSGKPVTEKLNEINDQLHKAGADCLILAALDEIAWTFNIRGTDVTFNPVAVSYGFISEKESVLFINPQKMTEEIASHLKKEGVILADYSMIGVFLSYLPDNYTVFVDPGKTNLSLYNAIPEDCTIIEDITPANHLKSIKNETEIKGFRNALVKDGIALTKFYIWLEKQMSAGELVTELSASGKLSSLRAEQPLYLMDSFQTICGYAGHGAIVHYTATPETDAAFKPEGLLLMDSGGQYLDGTTDITRTIPLGEPTEQMKKDFTRTLKGMIGIAKCKFPAGIRGCLIDVFARKALWDAGIQYLHGTCHGIGHCLNVHEGPQSIRMEENPAILKPGMVMSDEPAMYRTGEYGIRTENIILIREDSETEWGKFLTFETLTLCYIDTRLVITQMLSDREHAWLNKYHQMVYDLLSPHLNEEEKEWLRYKTKEI